MLIASNMQYILVLMAVTVMVHERTSSMENRLAYIKKNRRTSSNKAANQPSLRFLESILMLKENENMETNTAMTIKSQSIGSEMSTKSPVANSLVINYEKALSLKAMASRTEEMLYQTLLNPSRYERHIRPTPHHSIPTNITFGVLLNQIVEMDERNQVLTTRCWINTNWLDRRLSWNASEW